MSREYRMQNAEYGVGEREFVVLKFPTHIFSPFLLAVLLLASCSPLTQSSRSTAGMEPWDIIERVNTRSGSFSTLQARGTISVESPSFVNSASFRLDLKRPDSARIIVEGPFGLRLASALFTRHHFMMYNSINNEVYDGDISSDELPEFMNLRFSPDDVLDTFCGTRTISVSLPPDSFFMDDDDYILEFRRGKSRTRYTVDAAALYVTSIQQIDSAGSIALEEQYEYDERGDGSVVPQSVRITQEQMQSSFSLFYDSVTLNGTVSLTLSIPRDARRVRRQ